MLPLFFKGLSTTSISSVFLSLTLSLQCFLLLGSNWYHPLAQFSLYVIKPPTTLILPMSLIMNPKGKGAISSDNKRVVDRGTSHASLPIHTYRRLTRAQLNSMKVAYDFHCHFFRQLNKRWT
jgi:hypothetical protein